MEVLRMCLPYVKRYCQRHQWNAFFFRAQITQILLFSRMSVLERSNNTVWDQHLFTKLLCYGSFRYLSTLRKEVFSGVSVNFFFFRAQISQILFVSRTLVLERSKITVWGQDLFNKLFCYERFRYLSTLREKVFYRAPVKCFFL